MSRDVMYEEGPSVPEMQPFVQHATKTVVLHSEGQVAPIFGIQAFFQKTLVRIPECLP